MGLSYAIEATSFTFITLLVARLGTSVMAGHQIVANLAALCFMVPLSLAVATATLTAHAIGAEDAGRAQRTAATGIRIALIAGASLALAVWTLRHPIVRLYTNDAAAAAVALTLVPFLAAFHVFDAVQTAVGFVLRAHKRAIAPTVVYALTLWGVGLVGGYHVAFRGVGGPPWGVTGMWMMQSVGPRAWPARCCSASTSGCCAERTAHTGTVTGLIEGAVMSQNIRDVSSTHYRHELKRQFEDRSTTAGTRATPPP